MRALAFTVALALQFGVLSIASPQEQAAAPGMSTKWTKDVSPTKVHPEYPRPQLVRKNWTNLNGTWDFAYVTPGQLATALRKILVPFPPESMLSGINEMTPAGHQLFYSRSFPRPKGTGRTILHFGAVDWEATVTVNGKEVGRHRGGYDPFSFDITDALTASGDQELSVLVNDPTDTSSQPRGKQVTKPGGIFYRPTSGIWQTVWLEQVPDSHIRNLRVTPSMNGTVQIAFETAGNPAAIWAEIYDGPKKIASGKIFPAADAEKMLELKVTAPKLWSPETPYLYRIKAGIGNDVVESYVGIREVYLRKNANGQPVVHLNGKPVFMFGPLDQGFWPDGLYTAPTDEALKYDIVATKNLGFNMIRKHVKVEPQRWYYWADKLGVLVLQDMPSGDRYIGPSDPDIKRTPESAAIYETEYKALIDNLYNHPSIISWVPFNEGWGQYDTVRISDWTKKLDPSRLVNAVSGWADRQVGDFHDVHIYPGPGAPKPEPGRALLLGEFGGLGLVVPGHTWAKDGWGYQSYQNKEDLTRAIEDNFRQLHILKDSSGLSGAVYTQTTDVETELNGLLTYDRAMVKPDKARLRKAILDVYKPSSIVSDVLPTSEKTPQTWLYSTTKPEDGWQFASFAMTGWQEGKGGFGTPETPGAVVGTLWNGSDIWLRREFELAADTPTKDLFLRIHHDDEVEVYLDGKLLLARLRWTSSYILLRWPGTEPMLKKGKHTLAVYCHQDRGGQFIDVGIVRVK